MCTFDGLILEISQGLPFSCTQGETAELSAVGMQFGFHGTLDCR